MTREYILVVLLGDYQPGDTFAQWPLHVTVVPWFAPTDVQQFITKLEIATTRYGHIHSTVGEQKIWGPNTVNVIDRVPELQDLHTELLGIVHDNGRLLVNQQYTGVHYTPHVTHQKGIAAKEGSSITIDAIYLIEKSVHVREKRVVAKFLLVTK